MKTLFDLVGEFHAKFVLPRRGDGFGGPAILEPDVLAFREDFMDEELAEFHHACSVGDLPKAVDALCDLVYVALGTAHMMRAPFDACFAEVQRANMTKMRASGADDPLSTRAHRLDVVKPCGFKPPNLAPIIEEERRLAAAGVDPAALDSGEADVYVMPDGSCWPASIRLTRAEAESGLDRQKHAELLISQLELDHDGRRAWLLNYGVGEEAAELRAARGVEFDEETRAAETAR